MTKPDELAIRSTGSGMLLAFGVARHCRITKLNFDRVEGSALMKFFVRQ